LLLLVWHLTACTSYRITTLTPQEAVSGEDAVRVTLFADGDTTTLHLEDPWVRHDSLGGTQCVTRATSIVCNAADSLAVPLSSVVAVQTKQADPAATAFALAAGAFAGLVAVAVLFDKDDPTVALQRASRGAR
jgi:hypothetical protein